MKKLFIIIIFTVFVWSLICVTASADPVAPSNESADYNDWVYLGNNGYFYPGYDEYRAQYEGDLGFVSIWVPSITGFGSDWGYEGDAVDGTFLPSDTWMEGSQYYLCWFWTENYEQTEEGSGCIHVWGRTQKTATQVAAEMLESAKDQYEILTGYGYTGTETIAGVLLSTYGRGNDSGFANGEDLGYSEGYQACQIVANGVLAAAQIQKYDEGYDDGYEAGYDEGDGDGYQRAIDLNATIRDSIKGMSEAGASAVWDILNVEVVGHTISEVLLGIIIVIVVIVGVVILGKFL